MNKQYLNISIFIILIAVIGLVSGYAWGYKTASNKRFPEIKVVGEINEGMSNEICKELADMMQSESTIPEGAMYAASKKGKYYYSVFDKRTYNLSVKNRIFFKTSKEAENMGYKKK